MSSLRSLSMISLSLLIVLPFTACKPLEAPRPAALPAAMAEATPSAEAEAPSSAAAPVASATKTNAKDGVVYVFVPAGTFTMGSHEDDVQMPDDAKPQTSVNTDDFWIMQTEVTNAQYKRCVEEKGCTEPNNGRWNDPAYTDHPVTNVSWQQAIEYAAWAGGRLPTEAEWEKACRGTDGRIYPWGDELPSEESANFGRRVDDTTVVGSYPSGASPYGALDMVGNVWEWTNSKYRPYPYVADDGRESAQGGDDRTLRGGGFTLGTLRVRCDIRFRLGADEKNEISGFRIVSAGD